MFCKQTTRRTPGPRYERRQEEKQVRSQVRLTNVNIMTYRHGFGKEMGIQLRRFHNAVFPNNLGTRNLQKRDHRRPLLL